MPEQSQNLNTNITPSQNRKRGYVFTLLIIVLLILVGSLFYISVTKNRSELAPKSNESGNSKFIERFKAESSSLVFPGFYWQKRFFENLDTFIKEPSRKKQFELLASNFDTLRIMYANSHDPKTRRVVEDLGKFLKENYPQDYAKDVNRFNVTCLDLECTKITYTEEVETLVSLVKAAKFKNSDMQKSILNKIDTATLAKNSGEKFNYFNSAFLDVQSAWQEDKNPRVLEIAQKLQEIIKSNYSSLYSHFEKEGYYKL